MTLSEITKVQLQQSIETYRKQLELLIQCCTIFVIADATTMGYAIDKKAPILLWISVIYPVAIAVVFRVVVRLTIPILATAVSIETKYVHKQEPALASTFIAVVMSHTFLEELRSAATLDSELARTCSLSSLKKPYAFAGGTPAKIVLCVLIFWHVIGPVILWRFFAWHLGGG